METPDAQGLFVFLKLQIWDELALTKLAFYPSFVIDKNILIWNSFNILSPDKNIFTIYNDNTKHVRILLSEGKMMM